jgi:hypothetical protein
MLFIQPHFDGSRMSDELLELGFRPSEADIAPTATLRIDLSLDLQDIHAGMKRKLRKWSRRWPRCGVTVRTGGKADIPLLADLIAKSAAFQNYQPLSQEYIEHLYQPNTPSNVLVIRAIGFPLGLIIRTRGLRSSGGAVLR